MAKIAPSVKTKFGSPFLRVNSCELVVLVVIAMKIRGKRREEEGIVQMLVGRVLGVSNIKMTISEALNMHLIRTG